MDARTKRNLVGWWAIVVVLATFVEAIHRLGPRAIATITGGLTTWEWIAGAAIFVLFVWGEGYRALQRRFAPRVAARAFAAGAKAEGVVDVLLAPLECLSLVRAERRGLLHAWGGVAAIVAAVLIVRAMPEPWRGIVDAGVSAALAWGAVALIVAGVRASSDGAGAPGRP